MTHAYRPSNTVLPSQEVGPTFPSAAVIKGLVHPFLFHQDQLHCAAQLRFRAHSPTNEGNDKFIPFPDSTAAGGKRPAEKEVIIQNPCHFTTDNCQEQLFSSYFRPPSKMPLPPGTTLWPCSGEVQGLDFCLMSKITY